MHIYVTHGGLLLLWNATRERRVCISPDGYRILSLYIYIYWLRMRRAQRERERVRRSATTTEEIKKKIL